MRRSILHLTIILTLLLGLSLLASISWQWFVPGEWFKCPLQGIWCLPVFYLATTYNPELPNYTVNSPEAVTAIVWDYRGLDTLFETSVFYLALIAGIALARGVSYKLPTGGELGLSKIVKTVSRLTLPMIITVGASIGLHGHLTPGGGFQGGATAAVAFMVAIVVFSIVFLVEHGVSKDRMLILRSIGLTGIGLTAVALFFAGLILGKNAYVFQNMAKPFAGLSFPWEVNSALISGTLWFFNLFEFLAVTAGFTIAFMLLAMSEAGSEEGVRHE
ncbi:Na(+)/H(+) antiporter subunit B [Desulfurococcus amylolyticus]|uniref:Na(+)/H(+) antiporter subunit B n=1 Tax=Desulfurococcus TaxID=2273 RepID=UPI0005B21629|nr:Na(+)/H(+) antiporter subunit B [Desulfurococcus amylolyticus]